MADIDWHERLDARGIGWYCGHVFPFPDGLEFVTMEMLEKQPVCGRWHMTRADRDACDHRDAPLTTGAAVLSEDRLYRYVLRRDWPGGDGGVCWIMLNPSTADETNDDPTIRRCITFTKRWGYQRLAVVNLFAYRTADPNELKFARVPIVGPDNHQHVEREMTAAKLIMCAWGANPFTHNPHRPNVLAIAATIGVDLYCLGMTSKGAPKHPVYVPAKQKPVLWRAHG